MIKNEPFAAFCNRIAADIKFEIPEGNYTIPDEYYETASKLYQYLASKKNGFDRYPVMAIQTRLSDMNEVINTLNENTVDGEIPNAVIAYFAHNLYSEYDAERNPIKLKGYNNLTEEEQNIIKVVSVYFMLQI